MLGNIGEKVFANFKCCILSHFWYFNAEYFTCSRSTPSVIYIIFCFFGGVGVYIGKLKLRCGSQFTSKMEGMMTDLAIGGDHEAAFEKYLKDGQDKGSVDVDRIDFNVQVRFN